MTIPSLDELKKRLIARKTESEESLVRRLGNAEKEIKMAKESGLFEKCLVNERAESFVKEAEDYILGDLYKIMF